MFSVFKIWMTESRTASIHCPRTEITVIESDHPRTCKIVIIFTCIMILVTEIIVIVTYLLGAQNDRCTTFTDCRKQNADYLTLYYICKYFYFHYRELTVNRLTWVLFRLSWLIFRLTRRCSVCSLQMPYTTKRLSYRQLSIFLLNRIQQRKVPNSGTPNSWRTKWSHISTRCFHIRDILSKKGSLAPR